MAIEPIKGESSMDRVKRAAELLDLEIEIKTMDQSTRTAEEAAYACGCEVGQIIKSLIFERADNQELVLVLVSGKNNADMKKLAHHFGTELSRADPRKIRTLTGFAIGGVAPIGHLVDMSVLMDEDLITYEHVWAAAGKPNAVFRVKTSKLLASMRCQKLNIKQ
ncbi:MAG: YbaK/EbsC family protein [Pseudomonadota bacterium]